MAKIDSAYDYYVSTYGTQKASRYDSHKKSDLRKVYNQIVKTNKESPLYKISNMDEAKRYAIDIKESAKAIQNVVASLTDVNGGVSEAFQKKVAVSSDEQTVEVEYVGDGTEDNRTNQFEIEVESLATPQVNRGNALRADALSFTPGSYAFDLNTNTASYEFQYNVSAGETNGEVLNKLARLVNSSNLKITADVEDAGGGQRALKLTSVQTGLHESEPYLFDIAPEASPESMAAMNLLGINKVTAPAQNSTFYLNGREEHSLNNTFTINNAFELTLKQQSKDHAQTLISFKANADAVADNIQELLDGYNRVLDTAQRYSEGQAAYQGRKLYTEMSAVAQNKQEILDSIGLMQSEDGRLFVDRETLAEAIMPDRAEETFGILASFRDALAKEAEDMGVNPMNYVNKVVVEYKNPGKNFATPYISSIYAGMMLDNKI